MNNDLFEKFEKNSRVNDETIKEYREKVPTELLSVWSKYGFGCILDGYLKVINPYEYKSIMEMSYFRADVSIPIFITAFGDIITWEENRYIGVIRYKKGSFQIISSGFKYFFNDLQDDYFIEKYLELDKYNEAIEKYGELEYDECFGYVPLLGLGGSEKVENLKKVKIKEHIELITQLVGKIE
ncbi:T6SS immunity protein Tdi1 domain-containing protein [Clostridium felsineum]|uniref:Uncharacterized protein n=1 Tax=Clostridium felsineum TaxID=36839 RepID=A0A1S8L344_9CLOT|nr:T6SS immunity protein Tdi1 domain-containing protein [Clostridium felsineum]URZ07502.1 hypothetical protein CLROS_028400 [Clostridium felsineum]URZ12533.1 hypothetical protein CROST_032550 [Clostridium felsineum]